MFYSVLFLVKILLLSLIQSYDLSAHEEKSSSPDIEKWCLETTKAIKHLNWNIDPCTNLPWIIGGYSVSGRALVFGDFQAPSLTHTDPDKKQNKTLIFSTVHGDEITPIYIALRLARWLKEHESNLKNARVIIAPLVNPDGFFNQPRKRVNLNGVDINRNFATRDWDEKAIAIWKKRFKSNARRFPGNKPNSEPETLFQKELIQQIKPEKILSIHSPLGFLDYDGPGSLVLSHFPVDYIHACDELRKKLKAIHGGFFTGSLGNYAGYELGIPTLTLELPSTDPKKAELYWSQFTKGIETMINFSFEEEKAL